MPGAGLPNQPGDASHGPGTSARLAGAGLPHPSRTEHAMTDQFRMLDHAPGRRTMTVRAADLERIVEDDPYPDLSWLEPDANPANAEANAERLAACREGEWHCIGVRARAAFLIDLGHGVLIQTVESPGLWGIESDSDPEYLDQVFAEEARTLRGILAQLNVTVIEARDTQGE